MSDFGFSSTKKLGMGQGMRLSIFQSYLDNGFQFYEIMHV